MKNLIFLTLLSMFLVTCKKDDTKENCPARYTGSNCDEQITPVGIMLNSVEVLNYRTTDNGAGWDLTSGPDCYISIIHDGVSIFSSKANFKQNAVGAFTIPVNILLSDVNDIYRIQLFDYDDLDADDFMGEVNWLFYSSLDGFPGVVNFTCANCITYFRCNITYL